MLAAQAKLDALSEAMGNRDWDAAEKALPAAAGVLPPKEGKELRESIEAQIGLARGDPSKFYAQLSKLADEEFDDAEAMNEIAWRLLTMKSFEKIRNLTLAEKCAVQAVKLTKEDPPRQARHARPPPLAPRQEGGSHPLADQVRRQGGSRAR